MFKYGIKGGLNTSGLSFGVRSKSYRSSYSPSGGPPVDLPDLPNISGLAFWLDAADTSTITESGGLVSQWNDKSSNGYNVTQAAEISQPTTGSTTLNSFNVLDFSNDFLAADPSTINNWAFLHNYGTHTMFVVWRPATSSPNTQQTAFGVTSSTVQVGTRGITYAGASGVDRVLHAITRGSSGKFVVSNLGGSGSMTAGEWHTVFVLGNPGGQTANSRSGIIVDGGATIRNNNSTTSSPSLFGPTYPLHVGNVGNLTDPLYGSIAEIILFNRLLDSSERLQLQTYANEKWGI